MFFISANLRGNFYGTVPRRKKVVGTFTSETTDTLAKTELEALRPNAYSYTRG